MATFCCEPGCTRVATWHYESDKAYCDEHWARFAMRWWETHKHLYARPQLPLAFREGKQDAKKNMESMKGG